MELIARMLGFVWSQERVARPLICSIALAFALQSGGAGAQELSAAERRYNEAWGVSPDDPTLHLRYASRMARASKLEPARQHYEKALALQPDLAQAHLGLGRVLERMNAPDEAIVRYERAVALDPTADARLPLGRALLDQDRVDEAITQFEAIVASNAKHARAHYHLGRAREKQGDPQAAHESYRRALELAKAAGERSFVEVIERRLP